jgi:hypothetical protein
MINNFIEAKNRQKQSKAGPQQAQKHFSVMGRKIDLNVMNYNDLHELHDKLINTILTEEESLINNHRTHVDKMCEFSTSVDDLLTPRSTSY